MTYLKFQNKTVMRFDLNQGVFDVVDNDMLPFALRDSIITDKGKNPIRAFAHNYQCLMGFLGTRSLSIKRENAKKILTALHIPQSTDDDTVLKMMLMCKALSITDDYWLTNDANEKWENVNLRQNPLHEAIAQISLLGGSPLTITGEVRTPELTGQGAYAKAWEREDGKLFLLKASTEHGKESQIEVCVSNLLDYTNVPHVHYGLVRYKDKICSKCENMCSDKKNIITAMDVSSWCTRTNRNFDNLVRELDPENFYKTIITDYLISNPDRHLQNWGFYMDCKTGKLLGLHPLFDHNNAFDKETMALKDGAQSALIPGMNQREAALMALKHCDYKVEKNIPSSVFISNEIEKSFYNRMRSLKMELTPKVKMSKVNTILSKLGIKNNSFSDSSGR